MAVYSCDICGDDFNRRGTKIPKFCSFACRNKSYEKTRSMTCKQCKKEMSGTIRQMAGKRKFCSQICVNEWKKIEYAGKLRVEHITVNCNHCGESMTRMPCKVSERNYCNHSCAAKDKLDKLALSPKTRRYKVLLNDGTNIVVRSTWEAVFIRDFLEKKGFQWKYEPETFSLKIGCKYTPDFYLENDDVYVEIKGYDYRGDSIFRAEAFREETGYNLLYLKEKELKNIYGLNLSRKYLETIAEKMQKSEAITNDTL